MSRSMEERMMQAVRDGYGTCDRCRTPYCLDDLMVLGSGLLCRWHRDREVEAR